MTTVFNRRPSSVVKKYIGNEGEYSVDEVTVLITATSQIGDVLYNNAGVWTLAPVASTADIAGVLIDERLRFGVGTATGQVPTGSQTLQVVRRAAIVDREYLTFASDIDTDAEVLAAEAALLAVGIKSVNGY